ncbi:MAG: hypothetical protein U1F76_19955 [Candidatus Competibacteraceae bacterium]
MAPRLSPDTEAVVKGLFAPQDCDEAIRLLINECGNNIPNSQDEDEYQLEDLRLQVLCMSKGDLKALRDAIDIAKQDFRELSGGGNIKAFKREVLGDRQAAQRIRHLDRLCGTLMGVSGIASLSIGVTGVSFLWLALPVVLVAIATEAMYRNSTDRPAKVKGLEYRLLLLASRVWPGILISGAGYLIGYFVVKVFIK